MLDVFTKIGWAAGDIHRHAHRLTIERDDPQGSAAVEDEEETEKDEQKRTTVDENEFLDEDDLDDQPRSWRSEKEQKLVDRLKSDNDRLLDELKKQNRRLEEFETRFTRVEQERAARETREDVNQRSDAAKAEAARAGRELAAKVRALDNTDPEYSAKVYTLIEEHNRAARAEDIERVLEEVDRRSSAAVTRRMTQQERYEDSKQRAIAELERTGVGKQHFQTIEEMAVARQATNPNWFREVPDAEQIPALVAELKGRLMTSKRSSQAFQDEKRTHRADMGGVLADGSRNTRRGRQDEEDGDADGDEPKSAGSILVDIARNRENQRKYSNVMLRRR